MVVLKCPRCGHVWDYRGSKQYYAKCPSCLTTLSIRKNRVEVAGAVANA